ncbi:SDR family oxidoreductase [Thalassiella azotivora]
MTGASAGIGLAFCRRLASEGHDLVLVARDAQRLERIARDLREEHGVDVEVLPADLADRDDVQRVAERAGDPGRPVDLLVNNAGFGLRHAFLAGDVEDQERMLDVLCRAVLVVTHAATRAMVERGHGAVVTVSSVAGFATMGTYSAAKAWATTFTEALAGELRGTGVTATALCPGFVRTEFHERAAMDMSALPQRMWLDADDLVRDCLDDVRRGRVVSVPSWRYRFVTAVSRHAPRPLVRQVSWGLRKRRDA